LQKKILILAYSNLNSDPRIKKEITALQNDYEIVTAGITPIENPAIKFYPIRFTLPFSLLRKIKRFCFFLLHKHEKFYWDESRIQFTRSVNHEVFDLIIANDISTLPLAFEIAKKNTKIYFDAHEYHPKEFEDSFQWRLMHQKLIIYLCKKYIPKTDFFTTVCTSIAQEYALHFKKKPEVITNATSYQKLSPSAIENNKIRIIHHGAAIPSRKLELMLEVMKKVNNRFSLDLMLVGNKTYIHKLKKIAQNLNNVRFIPPVKQESISQYLNQYDLGIYILQSTNFNNENALPNKLFDFIQARLGIVISPNPEMKRLVEKYGLGKVAKDYTVNAMAETLNVITLEDVKKFKNASHRIAYEVSSETNIKMIKQYVEKLLI